MHTIFEALERYMLAVLKFVIDRVPLPRRLRAALRGKRDVLHEVAKFGIAGGLATIVFYVFYEPLLLFGEGYGISAGLAFALANLPAIVVSYVISAKFVFENNASQSRRTQTLLFFVLNAAAVAIGYFALGLVEVVVGGHPGPLLGNVVPPFALIASWGLRFVVARRFIFKSHLERPAVDLATELAHLAEEIDEADADHGLFDEQPARKAAQA